MANIGSKRLVVGAHYGLKEFMAQRITAVVMAAYTVMLVVAILTGGPMDYATWVRLFAFTVFGLPLGKLLAFLAVLSLCYHAWIGMRDIWMDYVKPTSIRLTLQVLTVFWLAAAAVYAALILLKV